MCSPTNDNETETKPKKKSWIKLLILFLAILLIDIVYVLSFYFNIVEIKTLYEQYKKVTVEKVGKVTVEKARKLKKQDENPPVFNEYMPKIQQKIKNNWEPVKTDRSKTVILLFKVYRDGKVSDIKVKTSSGDKEMDNSAIEAVLKSSPLEPLPKEYEYDNADILFTFDYNVWETKLGKKWKR